MFRLKDVPLFSSLNDAQLLDFALHYLCMLNSSCLVVMCVSLLLFVCRVCCCRVVFVVTCSCVCVWTIVKERKIYHVNDKCDKSMGRTKPFP